MFELKKNDEINRLIAVTKSDSGISGPDLANAHMELGRRLGAQMKGFPPEETTIVAMLRGGIFFAEGMYLEMRCRFELYDPGHGNFVKPKTRNVILADSVINTGRTILEVMDSDTFVACCVINAGAVPLFDERLYTVRISENSFVGDNVKRQVGDRGPDTTMRLFNQI